MDFELDYSKAVFLDAEDLAEQGILAAYQELLPELRKYVEAPDDITELMDHEAPRYAVRHREIEYVIYSPEILNSATHLIDSMRSTGGTTSPACS
jgi:hypothetical protein